MYIDPSSQDYLPRWLYGLMNWDRFAQADTLEYLNSPRLAAESVTAKTFHVV